MIEIAQRIVDALTAGSFFALFALGITVVFGIMNLVNFAHGELLMAGAYAAFVFQDQPWPIIVLVALVTAVALSLVMERLAFRPVRGASPATLLITSFAVSFGLQAVARLVFTSLPRSADIAPIFRRSFKLAGVNVTWLSAITLLTTLVLLVALAIFFSRTRLGIQMRAAAEDWRMASLCGVPANLIIAAAFAISGVLAGVAAILLVGQTGSLSIGMGLNPVLFGFTAAVIGGLGSLHGAVLGGYLLGAAGALLQALLPFELGAFRDALLFGAVFGLMALRPGGLLRAVGLERRV